MCSPPGQRRTCGRCIEWAAPAGRAPEGGTAVVGATQEPSAQAKLAVSGQRTTGVQLSPNRPHPILAAGAVGAAHGGQHRAAIHGVAQVGGRGTAPVRAALCAIGAGGGPHHTAAGRSRNQTHTGFWAKHCVGSAVQLPSPQRMGRSRGHPVCARQEEGTDTHAPVATLDGGGQGAAVAPRRHQRHAPTRCALLRAHRTQARFHTSRGRMWGTCSPGGTTPGPQHTGRCKGRRGTGGTARGAWGGRCSTPTHPPPSPGSCFAPWWCSGRPHTSQTPRGRGTAGGTDPGSSHSCRWRTAGFRWDFQHTHGWWPSSCCTPGGSAPGWTHTGRPHSGRGTRQGQYWLLLEHGDVGDVQLPSGHRKAALEGQPLGAGQLAAEDSAVQLPSGQR